MKKKVFFKYFLGIFKNYIHIMHCILVCVCVSIQPHLEGIMRGSVPSEYRRLFLTGTAREKHTLKTCSKFGPCQKWGAEKVRGNSSLVAS